VTTDRTVHAVHADLLGGTQIVRYDRAGKWYAETPTRRFQITVRQAAVLASLAGSVVHLGQPGGAAFDRQYRQIKSASPDTALTARQSHANPPPVPTPPPDTEKRTQ
jgi:hypothetical protein